MNSSKSEDRGEVLATYRIREVVGLFHDFDTLERAVEELEAVGFDRSQINMLASKEAAEKRLGRPITDVRELEDAPDLPTDAPPLDDDEGLLKAGIVSTLTAIGTIASIGVVVASGGGLAAAIAAAVAGGGVSGGLSTLLARWLDARRAREIEEQLAAGGLLLFVAVRDPEQERKAREILEKLAAADVHVHEVTKNWTDEDIPFAKVQPDPFLAP